MLAHGEPREHVPANRISIVVPVHNGGRQIRDCLAILAKQREHFGELLLVDDGSTDGALNCAAEFGAFVLRVASRRGPANSRNVGALAATGDIVLFLDADVCVRSDTIYKISRRFADDPELGAVFGSYDAEPRAPQIVSQFRNLLHYYVHQTSNPRACTFWSGCGAIRRTAFIESNGFDVAYTVPGIEDIELGVRLAGSGVRIALDPSIQVKHLKRWTLRSMVLTDIRERGIPWTRLILAARHMPNDLNLRIASRISVAVTGLLCGATAMAVARTVAGGGTGARVWPQALLTLAPVGFILALNFRFYRFLAARRGLRFAIASVPLHLLYFLCCGTGFLLGIVIHWRSRLALRFRMTTVAAADN